MGSSWNGLPSTPLYGGAGDGGITGINGEVYSLTREILYTVSVEELKNIPCFLTPSVRWNGYSFPDGHTLFDFFFGEGLPEALPKIFGISGRTFLKYPENIECWYETGYYVSWNEWGCEILACELFPHTELEEPESSVFSMGWGDMFIVLSPCRPLRQWEDKITFEKDIITFRPCKAGDPNPFKVFQPK